MKKYIKYIVPSLITFLILGIIYYFNNLYPFGSKALVQVDADYLYIPVLYKIYDLLHGVGNLFYDDIGLGNSLYASLIIQGSLFSPLNLLLYFVDRNSIIEFFGLFIIIKLCLISLTSYIYIDKTYKVNYFYKILFSILYTFNGFIILNYFNEIWLDIVILFPLLVLYLNKLLNDNNCLGYIIVLSICFIITFYFSYFIVIFILLYSFIYLYLYKKKKIKETIFKLGISTFIAVLISAFSSFPLMYQILKSERFNFDSYTSIFSSLSMKSLYLLFSPLFIIIFVKLLTKFKKDKVRVYGYFILVLLYIIPVIIDPINALIHGGSYWSFPYRYGFVTSFILMDACLYYINKYEKNKNAGIFKRDIIITAVIIMLGIIGVKLNYLYRNNITTEGILLEVNNNVYWHIVWMVAIVFAMYIIIFFVKNKWFKYISIISVSLYGIFLFTTWTIYYNSGYFLCTDARKVYNNMNLPHDGRYKVEYDVYTPDYGFMFGVPTLDNWLHVVPGGIMGNFSNFGYYPSGTSVYSYGGTIFSDYLLNFKYQFSKQDKINDDMYTLMDSYNGKYLYKYNYGDNYGMVIDKLLENDDEDKFDYQNKLYADIYDTDDELINYDFYESEDLSGVQVEYNIQNEGYLYFYSYYHDNINRICVNDDCIYEVDDYIKNLGYYDSDVVVRIYLKQKEYFNFDIGFIEKEKIKNLRSKVEYKDNKYYVNVDSEKYLFLPINNISGIHVYNNGKETEINNCLNNFICLKLNKGDNEIKVKYTLPLFKIGLVFSIIGLGLLFLYKKFVPNKLILNIGYWLYNVLVIGMLLYYYFYSLFKYII